MNRLPEPPARQPHATQPGQPTINDAATQFLADLESAYADTHPTQASPTFYRDDSPLPAYGDTPPVTQQGTPPMSQGAVDTGRLMLMGSLATVPPGLITIGVLIASRHADPTVVGIIAATPIGLAVPITFLTRLVKRVKETVEAAPPVIHQHYTGTVIQDQRTVNSNTRGVWATTRNQLPPGTQPQGKRL